MSKEALVIEGYDISGNPFVKRYGVDPKLLKENVDELLENQYIAYVLVVGKCYVRNFHTGLERLPVIGGN
jgi:hypothetical protein